MHSTYINDLKDCAYPFMAGRAYPFPLSLITGMSLCLYSPPDNAASLGISSISVANQRIFVVATYNDRPLGYFDLDSASGTRDSIFRSYASGMAGSGEVPMATGHMTIGEVPADAVSYSGFWQLDPSCVRFMVLGGMDMYSYYSQEYQINGVNHEFGKIFSIDTDGCLDASYIWSRELNGYMYALTLDVDSLGNWQKLYDAYSDDMPVVEAIGDVDIATLGSNKVYKAAVQSLVVDNGRSDIYMSITRGYESGQSNSPYLVTLTLTGTRDFPGCPGISPEDDGAYTPDEFYPREG